MRPAHVKGAAGIAVAGLALTLAGCSTDDGDDGSSSADAAPTAVEGSYVAREASDGTTEVTFVENPDGGQALSFATGGAMSLLEEESDGVTLAFKDMNANGELDTFEDWRVDPAERAAALAGSLTIEQISGLMLFSPHEASPQDGLTDPQREYLEEDHLRLILSAGSNDVEDNVTWTNEVQAFAESVASESEPYIPVTFSSDPRSDSSGGYSGSATAEISMWPGNLGLAATFDPETVRQFGQMASLEYRALGLTNALSPQIDIATDPRWLRVNGTFGEDPAMSAEMAAAFVEGFQHSYDDAGNPIGWGSESVSTVIKHFAGDAAGEGGRASYNDSGKYAVFPGDNFDQHLEPFMNALDSAGLMTSYSIHLDGDGEMVVGEERVAAAFNKGLVDILRVDHDYDGVIVTDWGVTAGGPADPDAAWFTNWGVEDLTVEERHLLALEAGIDMFGGNFDVEPVLAAYDMWEDAYAAGDLDIDAGTRWAASAERILGMLFSTRVFDDPFIDLENSLQVVGSEDKVAAGYEAQQNSVVVLKNDGGAIQCAADATQSPYADATVYIPRTYDSGTDGLFHDGSYVEGLSVSQEIAEQYFGTVVTDEAELNDDGQVVSYTAPDMADVDVVLVGFDSPNNGYGFAPTAGMDPLTGEYYPISLQYRPYTADGDNVRRTSISGNLLEDGSVENRTYFGATSQITNEANLDSFERAVAAVEASGRDIPVLTMLRAKNPIIPAEFEEDSDAIVVGFDISENALLDVLLGMHESGGRLPIAFPSDMDAVEANLEDVPFDVAAYVDSQGNAYEFGFGLGCDGSPLQ